MVQEESGFDGGQGSNSLLETSASPVWMRELWFGKKAGDENQEEGSPSHSPSVWIRLSSLALRSHLPFLMMLRLRASQLVKKCRFQTITAVAPSGGPAESPASPPHSCSWRIQQHRIHVEKLLKKELTDCVKEVLSAQAQLKNSLQFYAEEQKWGPGDLCNATVEEGNSEQVPQSQNGESDRGASDREKITKRLAVLLRQMDLLSEPAHPDENGEISAEAGDRDISMDTNPGLQGKSFKTFGKIFAHVASELLKRVEMQEDTLRTLRPERALHSGHAHEITSHPPMTCTTDTDLP